MSEADKARMGLYERALARIRDNTNGTRDKLFAPVVPKLPGATPTQLLKEARTDAERRYARHIGADLAKEAAGTLTMEHLREHLKGPGAPRDTRLLVGPRSGTPPSWRETPF